MDRAALDAARDAGIPSGGWCPRGRLAEDGAIEPGYALRETPDADPAQRTRWNVRDSDGTLILHRGAAGGGTALALERARALHRPVLEVNLLRPTPPESVAAWIARHRIRILNVAGPRESEAPGIRAEARAFLASLLTPSPEGSSAARRE